MDLSEVQLRLVEIKERWDQVRGKIDLVDLKIEIDALQKRSEDPHLWDDTVKAQELLQNLARLQEKYQMVQSINDDLEIVQEMLVNESLEVVAEVSSELKSLDERVNTLWQESLFSGEHDPGNALVFIQAGAGGVDAQDFADMITRMYLKFCDTRNFKVDMIEYIPGQEAGIKRSLLHIKGPFAYGTLQSERGVHRLVRISPFNANGKRQTSFVMVQVLPELPEMSREGITIDPEDVRVDVFRSGGAGGQSVNTTDSAVRVTHIPTGIVVSIQTERSQLQNKTLAFAILKSKLWERQQEERQQEQSEYTDTVSISWGNHIRSYVMNPYKLVKDQRSGYETTDVDRVLAGDLGAIIHSVLLLNQR